MNNRNLQPIKPLKDRKVSAVSLYMPPEIKSFWYDTYEEIYNDTKDKPLVSEFLSGMHKDKIKQFNISDSSLLTIELSKEQLEIWNKQRSKESLDINDVVPWNEFIIEKVNIGINLLDELSHGAQDTTDFEKQIEALKHSNAYLMKQPENCKQDLKIRNVTAGRNLIRDAIIEVLANTDKPLNFVD